MADTGQLASDIAVVGGGIVGLATTLALTETHPRARIVVLDKSRASPRTRPATIAGSIHSGAYYKPGSLKARLCVEGAVLMKRFCDTHGIHWDPCGKLIVATDEAELPRLQTIEDRAMANGLAGVKRIAGEEVVEYEPHCRALSALLVPETGIVDCGQVADTMAGMSASPPRSP